MGAIIDMLVWYLLLFTHELLFLVLTLLLLHHLLHLLSYRLEPASHKHTRGNAGEKQGGEQEEVKQGRKHIS